MACTQQQQLICFPRVRVQKKWFRYFNDHKDFRNEGTLHLFSLMSLFSYANFRSNNRRFDTQTFMEGPGQWICKLSALPRILRVHSKAQALGLLTYFRDAGFLDYEILDEETGILRYTINDWKKHCIHLEYNYYSYKGSGFFFFPLSVGRLLVIASRRNGPLVFSELDAIMDFWLHTVLNEPRVQGSEFMPVVYYSNMGMPIGTSMLRCIVWLRLTRPSLTATPAWLRSYFCSPNGFSVVSAPSCVINARVESRRACMSGNG